MHIQEKLIKYDLFDQSITKHGFLENNRDYEIIGYLSGAKIDQEVQYLFKGCIQADYKLTIIPGSFSMDDRLLDLERQDEPDFPKAFIWGVNFAAVYPGITIIEASEELKEAEKNYGVKFYQIIIETNVYKLNLIFHDIETKLISEFSNQT